MVVGAGVVVVVVGATVVVVVVVGASVVVVVVVVVVGATVVVVVGAVISVGGGPLASDAATARGEQRERADGEPGDPPTCAVRHHVGHSRTGDPGGHTAAAAAWPWRMQAGTPMPSYAAPATTTPGAASRSAAATRGDAVRGDRVGTAGRRGPTG